MLDHFIPVNLIEPRQIVLQILDVLEKCGAVRMIGIPLKLSFSDGYRRSVRGTSERLRSFAASTRP